MLKRLVKRRIVVIVIALLVLLGMLAAPIRREYSIDDHPCPATDCTEQVLTTDAHYGIPFAWLSLSKSVYQPSQIASSSSTARDTTKLIIDVASWGLAAVTTLVVAKNWYKIRHHANSRH